VTVVSWAATALVLALLVAFVGYVVSLRKLPTAHRADLRIFDRYGRVKDVGGVEQPRRK
jgi:hypothetical protein